MNDIDDKETPLEYKLAQMLVLSTQLSEQINDALTSLYIRTKKAPENDPRYIEMLSKPIDAVFTFDTRIHNVLLAEGILTVEQLLKCRRINLLTMPNLGRKSLQKIIDELKEHNLRLASY